VAVGDLDRLVEAVADGTVIDMLVISIDEQEREGFTICKENGEYEVSCSMLATNRQVGERFKSVMRVLGHHDSSEHAWNVGMGPEMESVTIDFHLSVELPEIGRIARALVSDFLSVSRHDASLFASVDNLSYFRKPHVGPSWVPNKDYFAAIGIEAERAAMPK
jgi:hypothetical protein